MRLPHKRWTTRLFPHLRFACLLAAVMAGLRRGGPQAGARRQGYEASCGAQRYTELIGTGRPREAEQVGERQLAEMQSRYGPTSTQAGRVLLYMGTGQQLIGGNRAADAYLRRAL